MRLRRRWRQKKGKWNTCAEPGCYYKTEHPDGRFCTTHRWLIYRVPDHHK